MIKNIASRSRRFPKIFDKRCCHRHCPSPIVHRPSPVARRPWPVASGHLVVIDGWLTMARGWLVGVGWSAVSALRRRQRRLVIGAACALSCFRPSPVASRHRQVGILGVGLAAAASRQRRRRFVFPMALEDLKCGAGGVRGNAWGLQGRLASPCEI